MAISIGRPMSKFFVYETILFILVGILSFNTFGDQVVFMIRKQGSLRELSHTLTENCQLIAED